MAATRRNINESAIDRDRFIQACILLKRESTGITTTQLGMVPGPTAIERDLSLWDLFVLWHVRAMFEQSSDGARNAAHVGPVFLPWHRWYLLVLEFEMRRVLGLSEDEFGLPYWDWASDGDNFTPASQITDPELWQHIGGDGNGALGEVIDGPFTFSAFPVNFALASNNTLVATNRGLRRNFGVQAASLPTTSDTQSALEQQTYDQSNFDINSDGFRNRVEGWLPRSRAPATHNRVHVWAGGDMLPGSSPNDPLFFLNHCNVDRLWSQWQQANPSAGYRPSGRSSSSFDPLFRQRAQDPLHSLLTSEPPVSAMLQIDNFYTYA